ncbi:hypothetical protein ACGFNU_14940 [Spirillospora sp. NPDC048911]
MVDEVRVELVAVGAALDEFGFACGGGFAEHGADVGGDGVEVLDGFG